MIYDQHRSVRPGHMDELVAIARAHTEDRLKGSSRPE